MTNIEYIRQLPGMEKFENKGNCVGEVGSIVGLDMMGWCDRNCDQCNNDEATINGKPAPYIFSCPVKPGMTVWVEDMSCDIHEGYVDEVSFSEDGYYVKCAFCGFKDTLWFDDSKINCLITSEKQMEARREQIEKEEKK